MGEERRLHSEGLWFQGRPVEPDHLLDVPYVPSEQRVVRAMLRLAAVDAADVVYDLGSGDGRIVIAAARSFGARAVGVEIDRRRVEQAGDWAERAGVGHMTGFIEYDLLHADFSPATVVTLYLLHGLNMELRPRLLDELRPGTRVVSHAFDMGEWKPDRKVMVDGVGVFLWIIPARVHGAWEWTCGRGRRHRVALLQDFQQVTGRAWVDGEPVALEKAVLWGDWLELALRPAGAAEAEQVFMRCGRRRWLGFSGAHRDAVARRVRA